MGLIAVLQGNSDIISTLVDRYTSLQSHVLGAQESLSELGNIRRQLNFYAERLSALAERAQAAAHLVSDPFPSYTPVYVLIIRTVGPDLQD